jgi:hypothetical protein
MSSRDARFLIEHYGDFNSAAKISQRNQTYRL